MELRAQPAHTGAHRIATASQKQQKSGPQGQAPPVMRDAVAAAFEQPHNRRRALKTTASHQHHHFRVLFPPPQPPDPFMSG